MAEAKPESARHPGGRRNSILASAIDVIARAGMEGLTTDAVAERAGVATGLMYKYFPTRPN